MPTVLRSRGFRFYFFAEEGNEPPHVHVDKGSGTVKFWLRDWSIASSEGLKPAEIRLASEIAKENAQILNEAWHEFHQRKS
jgi:hypothetical protein